MFIWNNKLTTAVKRWYRGKQVAPTEVMIGDEIVFELPNDGKYIQPFIVRLFKKIISIICFVYSIFVGFICKHWKWIIIVAISLLALVFRNIKD